MCADVSGREDAAINDLRAGVFRTPWFQGEYTARRNGVTYAYEVAAALHPTGDLHWHAKVRGEGTFSEPRGFVPTGGGLLAEQDLREQVNGAIEAGAGVD